MGMKHDITRRGFGNLGQDMDVKIDAPDMGDPGPRPTETPRAAPPSVPPVRTEEWKLAHGALFRLVSRLAACPGELFSYSGSLRVSLQLFEAHLPQWADAQGAMDACARVHERAVQLGETETMMMAGTARDLMAAWMRSVDKAPRPLPGRVSA